MFDDQVLLDQVMQVKKAVVGILLHGVISSNANVEGVMDLESNEASSLNRLLEYSNLTRKHLKVERMSLSTLPIKPVISENRKDVFSTITDADMFYSTNQNFDFFRLSYKTMSNALFYKVEEATTAVTIMRSIKWSKVIWEVRYFCDVHGRDRNRKNDWTATMVYPERDHLLNFLFSPIQLTPEQIMDYMGGSENFKRHTHFCSEFIWNGFRHMQFWYESVKLGSVYAELKDHPMDMKDGIALLERGDFRFSMVELGTIVIGGIKHWIYTGSERIEYLVNHK